MTLTPLLQTQLSTLNLFLSTPATKTPTILLLIASFGSSLHHPVTTFFYLAVINDDATAPISIGSLGFIQALGGTVGGPIVGHILDRYGPWIPIVVTAASCSLGCLWRGFAQNLHHLQLGAILNGIGVNLWTVVLGHLVKSFPSSKRSEVLSGIGVQLATVQILGKALFPFVEYGLKNIIGVGVDLVRYRLHMGVCTAFCFYGTIALFWDKSNVGKDDARHNNVQGRILKEKMSDVFDDLEGGLENNELDRLHNPDTEHLNANGLVEMVETSASSHTNGHQSRDELQPNISNTTPISIIDTTKPKNKEITILFIALLLQSLSNTIITVLWPLLIHDRFHLTAQTFGILTFISSVTSMGAMAGFPLVEKKVGRMRCAAYGFGIASILGVLFCACLYGGRDDGAESISDRSRLLTLESPRLETNINASVSTFFEDYSIREEYNTTTIESFNTNQRINKSLEEDGMSTPIPYMWHGISAIALQASLSFLEPSLKSILSITQQSSSSKPSLGLAMGSMTTIMNVGGMIGNVSGTWMYKLSKDFDDKSHAFFRQGSLPFFVCSVLLGLSSIAIWGLEEPASHDYTPVDTASNNSHIEKDSEDLKGSESPRDGCCLRDREMNHELKCD